MNILTIFPFLVLSYMIVYRFVRFISLANKDRLFPKISKTYTLGVKKYRNSMFKNITCNKCGMISYNKNDIEHLYCGNCHIFHIRFD